LPAALAEGFSAEVDQIGEEEWSELIQRFDDATLYQTWSYGAVRWGASRLGHIVLKKDGAVRAAAQLRIIKLPLLGIGIGYVFRGPFWRLSGQEHDPETFRQVLRALRLTYADGQGLLIKVIPNEVDVGASPVRAALEEEGFEHRAELPVYRTFVIDLARSMEELRSNLHKRWRSRLKKGEQRGFEIVEGTGDDLFLQFAEIYREMCQRKQFVRFVDIDEFRSIQARLPEQLKMKIMLCKYEGDPVAAGVFSVLGATAVAMLAATSNKALDLHAANYVKWRQIAWLKERGVPFFDLGGVERHYAPGPYAFKAGLAGKGAEEVCYLGTFECSANALTRFLVFSAEDAQWRYRKFRLWLNRQAHALQRRFSRARATPDGEG